MKGKQTRRGRLCVDIGAALKRQIDQSRKENGRTIRSEVAILLREGYRLRESKT